MWGAVLPGGQGPRHSAPGHRLGWSHCRGLRVPGDVDAESKLNIPEILSPWKIPGHFTMFSRAIPSPLCQGGHCRPPGAPVIHSQVQRAVCPAPSRLTPDPARWGITTHGPRASVCLQHGADLSPCEVSQEKSETHRVSCPRLSGECQAEPKGCKVLIPLAPPIAPETGTHTQTLSQTHTHKHTNKRYTQTQHIHYLHTYT